MSSVIVPIPLDLGLTETPDERRRLRVQPAFGNITFTCRAAIVAFL
jgi:hypothetical protein